MNSPCSSARPVPADSRLFAYETLVRPDGMVHHSLFTDPAVFDQEMH